MSFLHLGVDTVLFLQAPRGGFMRTAQVGDRVQVHYVKRLEDGSVASSQGRPPLELTVGVDHPRLPGLGLALVGLAVGQTTTLRVPPEQAYGLRDPDRVCQLDRRRFPSEHAFVLGEWTLAQSHGGKRRVRILEVREDVVIVDGNHRRAGQALQLTVTLLAIEDGEDRTEAATPAEEAGLPTRPFKAIAFDVDAATLESLRRGFPSCQIQEVQGACSASLRQDWNPGTADLLVIGARENMADMLGLCRGLRSQSGRSRTPLLVLVPPTQDDVITALLEAGADSCLAVPVHPKQLVRMVARAVQGNQPGRHTLGRERAQSKDRWRDEGGEG
jgi:peptidylprolyl isomerase